MLVQVFCVLQYNSNSLVSLGFCVLLVTHGRFTYRRINGHTDRQTDRQLTLYLEILILANYF